MSVFQVQTVFFLFSSAERVSSCVFKRWLCWRVLVCLLGRTASAAAFMGTVAWVSVVPNACLRIPAAGSQPLSLLPLLFISPEKGVVMFFSSVLVVSASCGPLWLAFLPLPCCPSSTSELLRLWLWRAVTVGNRSTAGLSTGFPEAPRVAFSSIRDRRGCLNASDTLAMES